jgi:hypothetical protein
MLDLQTFTKKLESGGYKDIGGARKAVGKALELSNKEKDQARTLIDKYFSSSKSTAKHTPKVVKRKSLIVKGPTPARTVQPQKVARKAYGKGVKKAVVVKKVLSGKAPGIEAAFGDMLRDAEKTIAIVRAAITAAGEAVAVAQEFHKLFPDQDISKILSAADVLKQSLALLGTAISAPLAEKADVSSNGSTNPEELSPEDRAELEHLETTRPSRSLIGRTPATS